MLVPYKYLLKMVWRILTFCVSNYYIHSTKKIDIDLIYGPM